MSNLSKGVAMAHTHREVSMETLQKELVELNDHQLAMVYDYIRGLRAADIFLARR